MRAVLTKSRGSTSSIEVLVIRVAIPRLSKASADAGRTRWRSASPTAGRFKANRASSTDMWVIRGNGGGLAKAPLDGTTSAGPAPDAGTTGPQEGGGGQPPQANTLYRRSAPPTAPAAAATPK